MLPEMPLFSLSRLLIYKEKETHHEKMHVHPGSRKNVFNWEIGAIVHLQPATLDGGNSSSGRPVAFAKSLFLQVHYLLWLVLLA